jgi:hypothetical protein
LDGVLFTGHGKSHEKPSGLFLGEKWGAADNLSQRPYNQEVPGDKSKRKEKERGIEWRIEKQS